MVIFLEEMVHIQIQYYYMTHNAIMKPVFHFSSKHMKNSNKSSTRIDQEKSWSLMRMWSIMVVRFMIECCFVANGDPCDLVLSKHCFSLSHFPCNAIPSNVKCTTTISTNIDGFLLNISTILNHHQSLTWKC